MALICRRASQHLGLHDNSNGFNCFCQENNLHPLHMSILLSSACVALNRHGMYSARAGTVFRHSAQMLIICPAT